MKSRLWIVFIVIIAVAGSAYLWQRMANNSEQKVAEEADSQEMPADTLQPKNVPDSWEAYTTREIREGGIAFAYPAGWDLVEGFPRNVQTVNLKGDGYEISIGRSGGGLPSKEWTHPYYMVDEHEAKTWQAERGDGYELIIVVEGYQFWIYTPDKTKDVSDEFLTTVNFGI